MLTLLRFEWRYHTRQASFLAASLLFLVMGFAVTATGFGPDSVRVNAPWLVMEATGLLSLLSLFAVAIFASNAVLRDVEHGMLEIVFTTPVGRFQYLFGRFAGVAGATMTVATLSAAGMLAATLMPWIPPERVGPLSLVPQLWSLLVVMLPNVLFGAALLFAVAALTRSAIATYVASVFAYVLYFAVSALTNSPLMAASKPGAGTGKAVALLDPFALSSFFEVTRYWSIAEKNDRFVALTGSFLANRMIVLAAAVAILAFVHATFSFRLLGRSRRRARAAVPDDPELTAILSSDTPAVMKPTAVRPRWFPSYVSATRVELRALVWNLPFLFLVVLWVALAGSEIYSDIFDAEYRTALYPTTALIVAAIRQPLSLFGAILVVYLSAEVFWREQRHGMSPILDATPVPGSVMIAAKWTALAGVIASLIASAIAAGIVLQLATGHTQLEPLVYLSLFYFAGLPLLLLAAAAAVIQLFSPGKYTGMVLVLLFVVLTRAAGSIGFEHPLWQFGEAPQVIWSDMDGFGANARPFGWLMLHWSLIAALFLTVASMAWRLTRQPVAHRLRSGFRTSTRRQRRVAGALLILSIASGGWIFYNTNVLNDYMSASARNDWRTEYEVRYRDLAAMPQPTVTDVDLALDFFPGDRRYHVAGRQRLANLTAAPIRTIWVAIRRDASDAALVIAGARRVETDSRFAMHRFDFDAPLAPGAHTEFRYELDFARRGFEAGDQNDPVLTNGTFVNGFLIFPSFGYRKTYELTDARERAKRGLPPRNLTAEESDALETSQQPRVNLTATLSTEADQVAIGPGRVERTWQRNGRRWFRYRASAPVSNTAGFGTGRYVITKRRAGDVDIEMYAHPGHPQNTGRILDAAALAMRTFETSFGPYPHGALRIVEVPRQRFAAYASPGVLWFAETRTPLTDARDPRRVDVVTRRVVHEVAHQWWGHQLVPPSGPGDSFLVETLAKHGESMIVERLRGRRQLDEFLEMELDRYLAGRSSEGRGEDPLLRVDSQAYVYYAKGAVVMNAIVDEIGEPSLNAALRDILRQPFPAATDILPRLRRVSSPESYALAHEWLTQRVLYDLAIDSASARRRSDGRYDVKLRITARKTHADAQGNEVTVPLDERIAIAVYADDGSPLHVQKYALTQGTFDVTLVVAGPPSRAILDPHVTRIDRNRTDNARAVVR